MKISFSRAVTFFILILLAQFIGIQVIQAEQISNKDSVHFEEIWVYLMQGEENFLKPNARITDLGYFAASVNDFGELFEVPDRSKLVGFNGRVHLVIALVCEGNKTITHFALDPKFPIRKKLIKDILKATEKFDGLQIDFEQIHERDAENFYSFLEILKKKIGKKTLSVAIFANTGSEKEVYNYSKKSYNYERIARIADRIIIMAYDEHYRLSGPGPIASVEWCKKVAEYSLKYIPPEKLVMGLPFYGRAWTNVNPAKAYKHSSLAGILNDKKIPKIEIEDNIPFFKYKEIVDVILYFENYDSIVHKSKMYYGLGIKKLAFWRLGQEDFKIWEFLFSSLVQNNDGHRGVSL